MNTENISNEEKVNGVLADVSSWVATTEKLPDIDQDDKWNKDYQITKDVLTY